MSTLRRTCGGIRPGSASARGRAHIGMIADECCRGRGYSECGGLAAGTDGEGLCDRAGAERGRPRPRAKSLQGQRGVFAADLSIARGGRPAAEVSEQPVHGPVDMHHESGWSFFGKREIERAVAGLDELARRRPVGADGVAVADAWMGPRARKLVFACVGCGHARKAGREIRGRLAAAARAAPRETASKRDCGKSVEKCRRIPGPEVGIGAGDR